MTLLSKTASLEANVARFESDLNKAEFMARRGQRRPLGASRTRMWLTTTTRARSSC